ncbi:hypothetical protein [Sphaerisporangium corydalis]|uniref:Antitoxin n=1 Tax=Sphaerisporangium corydalis TaxID=1441875 RepID=A0ABV9E4T3_9ACTN|nr:hypothetical protein [Sphaerisporangium corydalis]
MTLVEIPDVPENTVNALKARAAERGLTLSEYLRAELTHLAGTSANAEVIARMAKRNRKGGPTVEETVDQIRRVRDAS